MPTLLTVHYESTDKSIRPAVFFATFVIAASAHATCVRPTFDAPLEVQLAALTNCQQDAHYLAQLGRLLTAQGQYADALDHLERALMLEPQLINAQLDYAIALAGVGDLLSAGQLLDSVLAQPDIPPDMRQTLGNARQRITLQQQQPLLAAQLQPDLLLSANLRFGHDSNPSGMPNVSSLALTTPGGIIVLPLAVDSNQRAGTYTRADFKLEYIGRQPDGSFWDLTANALQRTSPASPDANTRQTELTLGYSQSPTRPFAGYINTSWVGINTQSGTRYASQGLTIGMILPPAFQPSAPGTCSARAGLDWQNRNVMSNAILSGQYSGINTIIGCSGLWGGQWQLAAKLGQDRPKDANRPGGIQMSTSLRGVGIWPLSGMGIIGTALLDLEYNSTRDTTGYSPLLDNGAVRTTQRLSTRLEYQRQLSRNINATVGAEWSNQNANLALFRVKNWGPYAALRLGW